MNIFSHFVFSLGTAGGEPAPVERTPCIYFKMRGQSNAAGRVTASTLPAADQLPQTDIWNWNGTSLEQYTAGTNTSDQAGKVGYDLFLAQMLRDYHNVPVIVDKYAVGGTFLYQQGALADWNLSSTNEHWQTAKTRSVQSMQAAKANFFLPQYKVMIWHQGEEDATVEAAANAYQTNQENIFADERAITGNSNVVIIDALIVQTDTYNATVRTAKTNIDTAQSLTYTFEAANLARLSGDNYHLSEAGCRDAAELVFDIIKDLWDFTV